MAFTHLHVHSEYSPKDSIAKIPAIVRKVAADGQGAVAISDHGSLGGIWALREAAKDAGIKPIPAFEAYLALCPRPGMTRMDRHEEEVPRDEADTDGLGTTKGTKTRRYHHLTVLARTREGWGNLMQLHNRGYEAQWYGTPFIDYNMLATKAAAKKLRIPALEAFGDGIAVLTGCLGGPVQAPLSLAIRADREAAERDAREKSRRLAAAEHTARAAELERSAGEHAEQSLRLKSQAEEFSQQGREDMAEGPARAALEQDALAQAAHGEAAAQNHSAQAAEQDADSQGGLAEVARETAAARRSEARTNLQRLIDALGKENVHVEVMYHGIDREREILAELFALADEFGLLCVATGDSHCVEPHEEYAQDAFLAIGSKKLLDDPHRWRFNGQGYHVKSEAEMLEVFPEGDPLRASWQQACANTQIVADAVDADVIPEPEMRLPKFPAPEGMTSAELFTDLVWKGAKEKFHEQMDADGNLPAAIIERIEHEIGVVLDKGFADYFLILWDVVAWCASDYTADDWIAMQKGMALRPDRERKKPISTGPGRGCLTGDARVWTPEGYKALRDIRIGDTVRTHTGALREVANTFAYDIDEPLTKLRTFYDGADGATMTGDHKVLAVKAARETEPGRLAQGYRWAPSQRLERQWIPADDVEVGDLLCIPRPTSPGSAPSRIDVAPFLGPAPDGTAYTVTETEIIEKVATNRPYAHSIREVSVKSGVSRNAVQAAIANTRAGITDDEELKGIARTRWGTLVEKRLTTQMRTRATLLEYLRDAGFPSMKTWIEHLDENRFRTTSTPRYIEIGPDFLFVLGAWASNGWTRTDSGRVTGWATQRSKDDGTIAAKIKSVWGIEPHAADHATHDLRQFIVRSAAICSLFEHLAEAYRQRAETKHLPAWVSDLDASQKRALLGGLWWGDGCVDRDGRWGYTTVSDRLAHQVRDLLWAVGAPAGASLATRKDSRIEFSNTLPSWLVRTSPGFDGTNMRASIGFVDDGYVYQRVRAVETGICESRVYDIEVPDDHSYMTDSFVVHNSAAGAAVSYCLDIVGVDPIEAGLLFERFLAPDRKGMPDIDTDFEYLRRGEVQEFLRRRWGRDNVALIGTYNPFLSKGAIKAAARTLGLSDLGEKMAKLVPMVGPKPRPFAQFVPEGSEHGGDLREFVATEGESAQRVLALAQALEGVKASESIHACGVLVSPESLVDLIPLRLHTDKKTGVQSWVTRWEGPELEDFGMLKMDILGLRNLDIARYCEDLLREAGEDIDLDAVDASDVSDPRVLRTWQMLAAGTTSGVFQLESAGMTRLLVEAIGGLLRRGLAPTMADLSTIIALYRPGPMGERMHETWAAIKAGTLTSSYAQFTLDPTEQAVIAEILDETEGVIVLQEQLMFLAQSISGFGPYTKSKLQKAVSKKQMAELNKLETLFIDGGEFALPDGGVEIVPGGVSQFERPDGTTSPAFQRQTLVALWETFKASGNYLFNKAHSFAYAVLAFETAYLKANWPLQYAAGLLVRTEKVEARRAMLSELGRSGAEVLPPDLNIAGPHTFAEESRIVFGIAEVKGVSEQSAAAIVAEREHAGPFRSFADAAERLTRAGEIEDGSGTQVRPSVPAKEIAALIAAGGLDAFGPRREMTRLIGGYVAPTKTASPIPLTTEDVTVLPGLDWSPVERSARQMGVLRVALGQHPMQTQEVADLLGTWSPHTSYGSRGDGIVRRICAAGSYVESNAAVTVAGILSSWRLIERETGNFAFAVIEDGEDTIEVAIWNRVLRRIEPADLPGLGDLVVITGKVERRRRTTIVSTGDADSDAQAGDDPDAEGAVKVEEVVDELQIAADQVSTVRTATPEHGPALPPRVSVQSVFEGMTAKLQGAEEAKKPQRKRATKSQSEIPGVAEGQGAGRKAEAAPPAGPGPHAQAPVQAPDRAEEAAALALPADPDGSAETPMPDAPPPSLPAAAAPVAAPLEVAARTGGEPGALAAVWTAPGRDIPVQTRPESPVAPAAENPASTFGIPRGEHIAPRSAPTSSHPLLDDLSAYAALKRGGIQSS
ncbi:PHP domain-containing protein [Brachybacterium sp. JHP9]|uniref:DNA-directed DNA polymerase n=1 Tax=Brachybacterium equifaecis TaxID=2910770 RepID=A0ABT0R634_9MICO|nr:PHP domain-containing protein [Brachybacterium equifaecis]MCL6424375.1 PHP domain-containing protein [Brachybacterium equifaecis]